MPTVKCFNHNMIDQFISQLYNRKMGTCSHLIYDGLSGHFTVESRAKSSADLKISSRNCVVHKLLI